MPDRPDARPNDPPNDRDSEQPAEPDALGLGARDRAGSGTGTTADTSYDAHWSDPHPTGEPEKDPGEAGAGER